MLVSILNKEIGTERLIGNLFSVWVDKHESPCHTPAFLFLMHPRHQIAKEGEQEAGVWWHWFISSVGCQEGKVTCPWPTAWVVTVFTSCISRNEGMFIPKQSSALEFNGLPPPLAFNFSCVLSPASSLCQERAGRRARLGMYRNIPIGNITWNNLH